MMFYRLLKPKPLAFVPVVLLLSLALAYGGQAKAGSKAWPDAFPKKGVGGVPESVDKLTIAVDSWGTSELNPWALSSVSFLGDYYNLRLMMQDPKGDLAPAWAPSTNRPRRALPSSSTPRLGSRMAPPRTRKP